MPPIPQIWVSRVSPKIWVLLLLPKLRVVSVISWSSCRSATPPINHRRISAFGHSLIICVIIMIIQPAQFCALL
ncbi:hypothetical protein HH749_005209 [Escherichia coli]|nr:hypothetical protein [Escherichia coli]EGO6579130.1 hypothetical protein [Escherichia coli]